MDWLNPLTGFLGGVLATLLGAWGAHWLQRRGERRCQTEATRFQVYMKLMELQNPLFGLSCAESHGERWNPRHEHDFELMRWRIADEVRKMDDAPEVERILRVLFQQGFGSATERHEALREVLDELGKTCNPRYCDVMKRISSENMALMSRQYEAEIAALRNQVQQAPVAAKRTT